jgi:hypothetical protein
MLSRFLPLDLSLSFSRAPSLLDQSLFVANKQKKNKSVG